MGLPKEKTRKHRQRTIIAGLALLMIVAVLVSLALGRYPISPGDALSMLVSKVIALPHTWTDRQETLFFNVRLPRIVLALMVGCCLSAGRRRLSRHLSKPTCLTRYPRCFTRCCLWCRYCDSRWRCIAGDFTFGFRVFTVNSCYRTYSKCACQRQPHINCCPCGCYGKFTVFSRGFLCKTCC